MIAYPEDYNQYLSIVESELAIKAIKDMFEDRLSLALHLIRVSAPLFVKKHSGINDRLDGSSKPVSFKNSQIDDECEIVQSLAKWKRLALKRYKFSLMQGLYTDMNAIRKHEHLDNIHSMFVDQWDWECIIDEQDRTIDTLKHYVNTIYSVLLGVEKMVEETFAIKSSLAKNVTFIHAQELLDMYPDLNAKQREYEITKKHKSVFIIGIGDTLSNNQSHDSRAFDYDDWSLNGDLLVYYPLLDAAIELSSMGIRVNAKQLVSQSKKAKKKHMLSQPFHQMIINHQLPSTIGGGIGQSRMCLILLKKAHIGEVQASVWPVEMEQQASEKGIVLL